MGQYWKNITEFIIIINFSKSPKQNKAKGARFKIRGIWIIYLKTFKEIFYSLLHLVFVKMVTIALLNRKLLSMIITQLKIPLVSCFEREKLVIG